MYPGTSYSVQPIAHIHLIKEFKIDRIYHIVDDIFENLNIFLITAIIRCAPLTRDATNEFMCGVSVAPVAMWQLYDSAYTER